jgi:predicted HicB family RNase H-like nuclease
MEARTEYTHSLDQLDQIAFTLRLPRALHGQLKEISKEEKRSMNQTVILAIELLLKCKELENE